MKIDIIALFDYEDGSHTTLRSASPLPPNSTRRVKCRGLGIRGTSVQLDPGEGLRKRGSSEQNMRRHMEQGHVDYEPG